MQLQCIAKSLQTFQTGTKVLVQFGSSSGGTSYSLTVEVADQNTYLIGTTYTVTVTAGS